MSQHGALCCALCSPTVTEFPVTRVNMGSMGLTSDDLYPELSNVEINLSTESLKMEQ